MVLEGCSDDLKEHFLEKILSCLTCEEFQDGHDPSDKYTGNMRMHSQKRQCVNVGQILDLALHHHFRKRTGGLNALGDNRLRRSLRKKAQP